MSDQNLPPVPPVSGIPPAPPPYPPSYVAPPQYPAEYVAPGSALQPPPLGGPQQGQFAQTAPPKKSRKGLIIGLSVGAAVIVLGAGGLTAAAIAIGAGTAPENQVRDYLTALVDGDAERALAVTGDKPTGLLSDDAYSASSNHITSFELGSAKRSGDTTTVTATIDQGATSYDEDFTLTSAGKTFLIWDSWKLESPSLEAVRVTVDAPAEAAVTVNGVRVDTSELSALAAFPGDYEVALADENEVFSAEPVSASVVGLSSGATDGSGTATLEATLTEAGDAAAQSAVDSFLDACVAQPSLKPENCGFEARPEAGYSYTDIAWTITTRPSYTFGAWASGGWTVSTQTGGTLDAKAIATDASGRTGPATATIPNLRYNGTVSFVEGKAVFTPSLAGQ